MIGNLSSNNLRTILLLVLTLPLFSAQVLANEISLSATGLTLSWQSPDYDHNINVHQDNGEYVTSVSGSENQYTVATAGSYYVVATTDETWENWERSNNVVVEPGDQGNGGSGSTASCNDLPGHAELTAALVSANQRVDLTLNNEMWGTLLASDGTVCSVAATGQNNLQSQWLASRVISAQKANTANSLSLGQNHGGANAGLSLSTANLWAAVQPGGSLYGLQFSNPVNTELAYKGSASAFGSANDPMVGGRIGGVNVFGGGLALYNDAGDRVGAIGVSGDTSCRDHFVAWEARNVLGLDYVSAGVSGDTSRPDNIIFDTSNAFGHPNCLNPDGENAWQPTPVPAG